MAIEEQQSDEELAAADEVAAEGMPVDDRDSTSEASGSDEINKLSAEKDELQDRLLRTQAELENFRMRTQKEMAESIRYQSLPVIRDLLPGLDNLQRAIDAAAASGDTQSLVDGVTMVARQFQDVLKNHSAEPIVPDGETFDPNLHEAIGQMPSADHDPMTVLQVVEPGYRIHDRVIRPARVMVSCAPPQTTQAPADADSDEQDSEKD